jgi:hypothetical protein
MHSQCLDWFLANPLPVYPEWSGPMVSLPADALAELVEMAYGEYGCRCGPQHCKRCPLVLAKNLAVARPMEGE